MTSSAPASNDVPEEAVRRGLADDDDRPVGTVLHGVVDHGPDGVVVAVAADDYDVAGLSMRPCQSSR